MPSKVMLRADYHVNSSFTMGKIIRNQNIEKKSNFISSDFVLLLVCLIYRSKVPKNVKMICVAICGGSSYNMTGLEIVISWLNTSS